MPDTNNELFAKDLYNIWAHRTGHDTPFELLPAREMQAWDEIATELAEGVECTCGLELTCPECDAIDEAAVCEDCGESMVCPVCDAEETEAAPVQTMAAMASQTYSEGGPSL